MKIKLRLTREDFELLTQLPKNTSLTKAGFPLGEFVRANRERSNLIGWRQTLTASPANHTRFLLVREQIRQVENGLKF